MLPAVVFIRSSFLCEKTSILADRLQKNPLAHLNTRTDKHARKNVFALIRVLGDESQSLYRLLFFIFIFFRQTSASRVVVVVE